jgi:hypothetical protein
VVHGLSFQGGNGWLLYSDGALGTQGSPRSETMLLHTTDGGGIWTVQTRSAKDSY